MSRDEDRRCSRYDERGCRTENEERYDRYDRRSSRDGSCESREVLVGWGIEMGRVSKLGMYRLIEAAGDSRKLIQYAIRKDTADSQSELEKVLDRIDDWLRQKEGCRAGYAASVIKKSGHSFENLGGCMAGVLFDKEGDRCRAIAEKAASEYFPLDKPGAVPVYVRTGGMYAGEMPKPGSPRESPEVKDGEGQPKAKEEDKADGAAFGSGAGRQCGGATIGTYSQKVKVDININVNEKKPGISAWGGPQQVSYNLDGCEKARLDIYVHTDTKHGHSGSYCSPSMCISPPGSVSVSCQESSSFSH